MAKKNSGVVSYLRYGKNPERIRKKAFRKKVEKFLSKVWEKSFNRKHRHADLPLPTEKQRMVGEKLPKNDLNHINEQTAFAVSVFGKKLSFSKRKKILSKLRGSIKKKNLSILDFIDSSPKDAEVWSELSHLYSYLQCEGEIYYGYMPTYSGKVYLAKGWAKDRVAMTTPLHESVHLLHKFGVIAIDNPFAQAADTLFALERGYFKKRLSLKKVRLKDFDRKPSVDIVLNGITFYKEPVWSYFTGKQIGHWLFQNLGGKVRWNYLFERTSGLSHKAAVKKVRK